MEVSIVQLKGKIVVSGDYCQTILFLDSYIDRKERIYFITKLYSCNYYEDKIDFNDYIINTSGQMIKCSNTEVHQFIMENTEKLVNLLRYYDRKLSPLYDDEYNEYYNNTTVISNINPRYKDLIELHLRIKDYFNGDITQERLDKMCAIPFGSKRSYDKS